MVNLTLGSRGLSASIVQVVCMFLVFLQRCMHFVLCSCVCGFVCLHAIKPYADGASACLKTLFMKSEKRNHHHRGAHTYA